MTPNCSSRGIFESIRCSCQRSSVSSSRRRRLISQHWRRYSGRPTGDHMLGPLRVSPAFVATLIRSYGWSTSAISSSETYGPYESAVSTKSTSSERSRRSTARAATGSSGGPQMPRPVMRIAPKPSRVTSMSPPMANAPDAVAVTAMTAHVYPRVRG
jgi:hypothetical protein